MPHVRNPVVISPIVPVRELESQGAELMKEISAKSTIDIISVKVYESVQKLLCLWKICE